MSITFRPACPSDADAAVPLIYSSGPAAFDHVFSVPGKATALGFLRRALVARQIMGCYGPVAGAGVVRRGLRVERIIPPPDRRCWYVAHLGVPPELRGRGYGAALLALGTRT